MESRQKTITTQKATILVVELQPLSLSVTSTDKKGKAMFHDGREWRRYYLPKGNWKHLGKATELTEEDWERLVEDCICSHNYPGHPNYVYDKEDFPYTPSLVSATESGISLLKANGVEVTDQTHVFIKQ